MNRPSENHRNASAIRGMATPDGNRFLPVWISGKPACIHPGDADHHLPVIQVVHAEPETGNLICRRGGEPVVPHLRMTRRQAGFESLQILPPELSSVLSAQNRNSCRGKPRHTLGSRGQAGAFRPCRHQAPRVLITQGPAS
jgi:hypothetical protein